MAPEGEMAEGFDDFEIKSKFSDYDDDDFSEIDLEKDFDFEPKRKRNLKHPDIDDEHSGHLEDMIEGIFTESKVDKIIQGYFKVGNNEKKLIESKNNRKKLINEERKQKISKIKQLSESISQEVGSTKFLTQNPKAKLIGKTNKKNLVFEMNGKQFRVNTKGQVL
jgi:IMP dehydrogenase/GMP reductase